MPFPRHWDLVAAHPDFGISAPRNTLCQGIAGNLRDSLHNTYGKAAGKATIQQSRVHQGIYDDPPMNVVKKVSESVEIMDIWENSL